MKIFGSFQPRISPYELAQIKGEIQAVYDLASQAGERLDVDGVMYWASPDFQAKTGGRTFDHPQWTAYLKGLWARVEQQTYSEIIETLWWDGHEARVQVRSVSIKKWKSAKLLGPATKTEAVAEDAWIKTPSGWRIRRTTGIKAETQPVELMEK
jgi:hypothetical protein